MSRILLEKNVILGNLDSFPTLKRLLFEHRKDDLLGSSPINRYNCFLLLKWLQEMGRSTSKCVKLLDGLLETLNTSNIVNKENFLPRFFSEKNETNFWSIFSELILMVFFYQRGFQVIYQHSDVSGIKNVDFSLFTGANKINVEVKTPRTPIYAEEALEYLIDRLEQVNTGLLLAIEGIVLSSKVFDVGEAEKILENFKIQCEQIGLNNIQIGQIFHKLSLKNPEFSIRVDAKIPTETAVFWSGSKPDALDINLMAEKIKEESKHFVENENNIVIIDLTQHSDNYFFSDKEYYSEKLKGEILSDISNKIDAVLSFQWRNTGELWKKNVLYIKESKKEIFSPILEIWSELVEADKNYIPSPEKQERINKEILEAKPPAHISSENSNLEL